MHVRRAPTACDRQGQRGLVPRAPKEFARHGLKGFARHALKGFARRVLKVPPGPQGPKVRRARRGKPETTETGGGHVISARLVTLTRRASSGRFAMLKRRERPATPGHGPNRVRPSSRLGRVATVPAVREVRGGKEKVEAGADKYTLRTYGRSSLPDLRLLCAHARAGLRKRTF